MTGPSRLAIRRKATKSISAGGFEPMILASFRKIVLALTERPSSFYGFCSYWLTNKKGFGGNRTRSAGPHQRPKSRICASLRRANHTDP
jgi:hypothetical protein